MHCYFLCPDQIQRKYSVPSTLLYRSKDGWKNRVISMNGTDVQWEEYIINGGKECVYERAGRETQEPSGTS